MGKGVSEAYDTLTRMNGEGDFFVVLGGVNDVSDKGVEETLRETYTLLVEGVSAGKKIFLLKLHTDIFGNVLSLF